MGSTRTVVRAGAESGAARAAEEAALTEREAIEVALEDGSEQLATGARRVGVYGLAALVSLTWVLPVSLLALLVRSSSAQVQAADAAGRRFGQGVREVGLTGVAEVITWAGGPLAVTLLSVAVAGGLYVRGHRRAAAYVLGARLGAAVLSGGVKLVVDRDRPTGALTEGFGQSFPSGHTLGTTTLVLSIVALLVLGGRFGIESSTAQRVLACVGAAVCIVVIGASRLVLGVHYLSDVVAGMLVGAGWVVSLSVVAASYSRAELRSAVRGLRPGRVR